MGVYLMLELYVSVLGHVRLFPFLLHIASGAESVVDHEHYAVYGDLSKE